MKTVKIGGVTMLTDAKGLTLDWFAPYDGHPLYTYVGDGGLWYEVRVSG